MSFVPRWIYRNWRLKLAALGMAVFLWAVVRAEPGGTSTRTISGVPVVVEVADLNWTTAGPPRPATVDLRVESSFPTLSPIEGDFTVRIPVEVVAGEDTVIELRRDWVRGDGNRSPQVRDINPTRVRLTFERTRTASIPVYLLTEGTLPQGVALAQPLGLNPSVIRVRGPVGRIDALDSLPVGPLDLSSVNESRTYPVPVDTTGLSDLTFVSTSVGVDVRLEEAVEQSFAGVPVELDSLPEGVDPASVVIDPRTLQVTLRGGRTLVSSARTEELRAVVPGSVLTDLDPGELRVVAVRIRGVPSLVRAFAEVDSVQVGIRPEDSALPDDSIGGGDDIGGSVGGRFLPRRRQGLEGGAGAGPGAGGAGGIP